MYKIQDGKILEVEEREIKIDDVQSQLNDLSTDRERWVREQTAAKEKIIEIDAKILALEKLVTDAKAVGIGVTDTL